MYLNCNITIHVDSLTTSIDQDGFPIFITSSKDILTFTEVEIKNDWSKLGTDCDILLPLTVKISNNGQYLIDSPRNLFKSGDKITIKAWYDGYSQLTVFEGFIYDFVEGTPIKMRCMDYYYFLKNGLVGKTLIENGQKVTGLSYAKLSNTPIETVLSDILKGTGITLMANHISFTVENLSFVNVSPAYCLEWIKKELGITMNLFGNKLYFNLADVTTNTINLRSDLNVKTCEMQKPDGAFQKFKVQVNYKDVSGLKKVQEIGNNNGESRTYNLYCINKTHPNYNKLVDNTLTSVKLGHYSGKITTYLYPNIDLFDAINYQDVRFPDRSGLYVVRGSVLKLGINGFSRECTVAYLRALQPIDSLNPENAVLLQTL